MRTSNLSLLALALLFAEQAYAQDHSQHHAPPAQDHSQHQAATTPEGSVDHAAMGHAMPTTDEQRTQADHAAMGHDTPPAQDGDAVDHAAMGHAMPVSGSHAGHAVPPAQAHAGTDHAAHDNEGLEHAGMDHAANGQHPSPASELPRTPIPPVTDADRAAAFGYTGTHPPHDNTIQHYVLLDRLEGFDTDQGSGLAWEAQSWIGTDLDKLWLRSEGERSGGHTEAASLEVLYGRAFSRWWDAVVGVRHDFKPGQSQDFLAVGVIGMAPYKFEVEATAYLGERGQTAASFEVEYETLLTNRLVLQPLVEVSLYGKNDPARGIGSGLSSLEAGLRLRYEFTRKFAPYVGLVHERVFGNTAELRREAGEGVDDTHVVIGLRTWF